ncbi:MAG: hypothetical protein ACLFO5_05130 [Opitutales bacterium]
MTKRTAQALNRKTGLGLSGILTRNAAMARTARTSQAYRKLLTERFDDIAEHGYPAPFPIVRINLRQRRILP